MLKILHAIISNKYQIGEPLLKHRNFLLAVLILSGMIVFGLALQGCQIEDGAPAFDDNLNWLTVIETPPTIFETNFDQIQDQTEREPTAQEFDQDDQSFLAILSAACHPACHTDSAAPRKAGNR